MHGFVTITGGKLTTFRLMAEETMNAVSKHLGDERPCTTKTEPLPGSENGATYHLGERLSRKEAHLRDEQLICECEMVPRSKLEQAIERRATTNLDDIRRLLRLGMGPCQGGFCIYRAAGILHGLDGLTAEQADESLLHFLRERWKGVWPVLYGDQLRQARLDDWIFQGVLDVEHLPVRRRGGGGVVQGRAPLRRGRDRRRDRGAGRRRAAGRGRSARLRAGQGHRLDPSRAGDDRRARLRARSGRVADRGSMSEFVSPRTPIIPMPRSAPTPWPKPFGGFRRASSRDRSRGTDTSAIWIATICFRPRSARCGPRRSSPRRWPPATRWALERVCVVGTRKLRDFHAALCAANLSRAGIPARSVEADMDTDRADENSLVLARRFDDPSWRAAFAGRLALKLQADERVGLPAVLGIRDPHGAWSDLEHRLGRSVFEIPTLPPSVPGMRLYEILR